MDIELLHPVPNLLPPCTNAKTEQLFYTYEPTEPHLAAALSQANNLLATLHQN